MAAAPKSIFSTLRPWEILDRLATIRVAAEFGAEIPEAIVQELFRVLERAIPEVRLALDEIPAGAMHFDNIESVIKAAENALAARAAYRASAA